MPALTLSDLKRVNRETIKAAGPRYTPGVDASAPNLHIESLASAVESLGLTEQFRSKLKHLEQALRSAWKLPPESINKRLKGKKETPIRLGGILKKLRSERAGKSALTLKQIIQIETAISSELNGYQQQLHNRQYEINKLPKEERDSSELNRIGAELRDLQPLSSALGEIIEFIRSDEFKLIEQNRMFIRGSWGTGKTHFLCDVTEKRMKANLPTITVLAHRLPDDTEPLTGISNEFGMDVNRFLKSLNSLGRRAGGRALILIDGINEADRVAWRRWVVEVAKQVSDYPNIGLVLSCRSPFERQILTSRSEKLYIHQLHLGFDEIEFEAQEAFFKFYKIPNPDVPLMDPEFSNPLFLKILCTTLKDMSPKGKLRQFNSIASGQKGMTKILEDFIIKLGKPIEKKYHLDQNTCWNLMKGNKPSGRDDIVGFAVKMAEKVDTFVTREEAFEILGAWTGWTSQPKIRKLLNDLVTEGLLAEDFRWMDKERVEVIRFPFERFGDHIICRHLLEKYIAGKTINQIRRSFHADQPLGMIFQIDRTGEYKMPGLASALMLEFPERVKRIPNLSPEDRELIFFLPKKVRYVPPSVDPFLNGLVWRDRNSFTKQTDRITAVLLKTYPEKTFEVLVSLATRTGHPYSAKRLVSYLSDLDLPKRDLQWTEFLRSSSQSSSVYRFMDWVTTPRDSSIAEAEAHNMILLCAMLLTSNYRKLRDKATKCLVVLGEQAPKQLFEETHRMLSFNDPYVGERMLAASYGVLMRKWATATPSFKATASDFACVLYDTMFKPRAKNKTTHILMRDYARGYIELARKLNPKCLGKRPVSKVKAPSPKSASAIPVASKISNRQCARAKIVLGMDFENYTIGGLVQDRGNYDYKHLEYQGVVRQIKWRILNLGYSESLFKEVDDSINHIHWRRGDSRDEEKIDRYGKKYSWIAYFEVAGLREDSGKLTDYFDEEGRISDSDIDPSFPSAPHTWAPPLNRYFGKSIKKPVDWIFTGKPPSYDHLLKMASIDGEYGPWVVLDGYMNEYNQSDKRDVFTHICCLLATPEDINRLRNAFNSADTPGNSNIPRGSSSTYAFAGEVPWRRTYGCYLRTKSGMPRRHVEEVFDGRKPRTVRKLFSKLTPSEARQYAFRNLNPMLSLNKVLNLEGGDHSESDAVTDNNEEPPKYVEFKDYVKIPGIEVEVPVCSYGWERHHSTMNQAGSIDYPAPALCEALKLNNAGDMIDLIDSFGRPATRFLKFGSDNAYFKSHLLYLRKDLLKKYLRQTNQKLVCLLWGERRMHHSAEPQLSPEVWSAYKHVHRKMVVVKL